MVVCGDGEEAMMVVVAAPDGSGDDCNGDDCSGDQEEVAVGGSADHQMFLDEQREHLLPPGKPRRNSFFCATPMVAGQKSSVSPSLRGVPPSTCHHLHQYSPLPPDLDLHTALVEAVALEPKYQPTLSFMCPTQNMYNTITGRMRNGSCHVLRCLKVWYELPSDTFFLAVNTMDRFLTRMRAQPKHLSCIAVSAFHVACEELSTLPGAVTPSRDSVSLISQSKCTSGDVARMEDIIRTKLELGLHLPDHALGEDKYRRVPGRGSLPVTPLTMLKLLHAAHLQLLQQHFPQHQPTPVVPPLLPLIHKLEMVVCDARCANYRPVELALTLLQREVLATDAVNASVHVTCLQPLTSLGKVTSAVLAQCAEVTSAVLRQYDQPGKGAKDTTTGYHRQRLVWKLSNRTLRQLRPTDKLRKYARLPTIVETSPDTSLYLPPVWTHPLTESRLRVAVCGSAGSSVSPSSISSRLSSMVQQRPVALSTQLAEQASRVQEETMDSEEEDEVMETCEEEEQQEEGDQLETSREAPEEKMEEEETAVETVTEEKSDVGGTSEDATADKEDKAANGSTDKEESYSQVAKKMREEAKAPKSVMTRRLYMNMNRTLNNVQTSPLSKITLTPALSSSSSAVKNLTSLLEGSARDSSLDTESGYYGYHHRRLIGILAIEGIDGDVMEDEVMGSVDATSRCSPNIKKNAKRKKPRVKLHLVAHPRYYCSDSEMSSEHASSSSEEEMDSDYEKEFPPLPLPRPPHRLRKKASAAPLKKKKKSTDASPYPAVKSKTIRKMHVRKIAQK